MKKIGSFTEVGPCCTIIKIDSPVEDQIQFDFDNSSIYNTKIPSTLLTVNNEHEHNRKDKTAKQSRRRVRSKFKSAIKNSYLTPSMDGALHVASHHVLLHVPIGVFSTHAMEDQRLHNENGLFHACVDAETASSITSDEFCHAQKKTRIIRSYETTDEIKNTDGKDVMWKTWWTEVEIDRSVVTQKHLNPQKRDILHSSFIDMPPGYDSYAILGEPYNSAAPYHLLQFTFIDENTDQTASLQYSDSLYNNLLKRAGKNGLEASRSSGSQG